jgi:hypothetical protein
MSYLCSFVAFVVWLWIYESFLRPWFLRHGYIKVGTPTPSSNSASTKLPAFEVFEAWVHSHGGMDNRNIYEWFVRQLRAGG